MNGETCRNWKHGYCIPSMKRAFHLWWELLPLRRDISTKSRRLALGLECLDRPDWGIYSSLSPASQMLPQLFVAGTLRCKYNVGPWLLISVAILTTPLSRSELAGTSILPCNMQRHVTSLRLLHFKKKSLDRISLSTGLISYGFFFSPSLLFSEKQPNGTPDPPFLEVP